MPTALFCLSAVGEKTGGVEQIDGRERLFCLFALFFLVFFPSQTQADSKNPINYSTLSATVKESNKQRQEEKRHLGKIKMCLASLSGLASLAFLLLVHHKHLILVHCVITTCRHRWNDTHMPTHQHKLLTKGTTRGKNPISPQAVEIERYGGGDARDNL